MKAPRINPRFTQIRCSNCDAAAASVVVTERRKLVANLTEKGWSLSIGEATCPVCVATFAALSGERRSA